MASTLDVSKSNMFVKVLCCVPLLVVKSASKLPYVMVRVSLSVAAWSSIVLCCCFCHHVMLNRLLDCSWLLQHVASLPGQQGHLLPFVMQPRTILAWHCIVHMC